jgi:hypothetical protein
MWRSKLLRFFGAGFGRLSPMSQATVFGLAE